MLNFVSLAGVARLRSALSGLLAIARRLQHDRLLRNSVYMMATTIVNSGFGFAFWALAAHLYPASSVGLGAAIISAISVCAILATLGLGPMLVQSLPSSKSREERSATLTAAIAAAVLLSSLAGLAIVVVLPRAGAVFHVVGQQPLTAAAVTLGVVVTSMGMLMDQVFVAERRSVFMLVRNGAFSCLKLVALIAILPLAGVGALSIPGAYALSGGVACTGAVLIAFVALDGRYRLYWHRGFRRIASMRSGILGHHLISLGSWLPMYLLPPLVAARLAPKDNAYFYTTWMVCGVFFMVSPSIATSLFAEGIHAPDSLGQRAMASLKTSLCVLCIPAAAALLGGKYVLAGFGAAYASNGWGLLLILVLGAAPDAVTNIYIAVLRVRRRLTTAAGLNLGMAAVGLGGAWLLLPVLGIDGAGWAWVAAQMAGTLFVGVDLWLLGEADDLAPIGIRLDRSACVATDVTVGLDSRR